MEQSDFKLRFRFTKRLKCGYSDEYWGFPVWRE